MGGSPGWHVPVARRLARPHPSKLVATPWGLVEQGGGAQGAWEVPTGTRKREMLWDPRSGLLPPDFDGRDVYLNNTKHQKLHRKLSVQLQQEDQSESNSASL